MRGETTVSSDIADTRNTQDAALLRLARLIEPGSLLEATPECLVVAHGDGRIVFANRRAETLTGYSREELVGQPVDLLIACDLRDRDPGVPVETLCRGRDGATIPVEVHLGSIEGPERFLVVTLRDMTELQAGREARFEAEAKYRALVEQIPAVVYLDPVDENQDSIYVSPQVTELLGIDPQEWLDDPYCWRNHVHDGRHRPGLAGVRGRLQPPRPAEPRVPDAAPGRIGEVGAGAGVSDR